MVIHVIRNDIQGRQKVGTQNTLMPFYQFYRLSGSQKTTIIQSPYISKHPTENTSHLTG